MSLPVQPLKPLIGMKANFADGAVPEGQPAEFDIIAIDPDGKLIELKGADWTLKRLTRDWQWFNSDGEWRYEAITRSAKIDQRHDRHRRGSTRTVLADPLDWGEYRLEIARRERGTRRIDFSSGYYYGDSAKADTPDTLKLGLDRTDAKPGDTVNVKIEAR